MPKINSQEIKRAPGALPIIGHGHKLADDPDKYFNQCRADYGDVFTLRMQGVDTTYLTQHSDINGLFANSKNTSADPINKKIVRMLFGQSEHNYSEVFHEQVGVIRDCLKNKQLTPYIERMQSALSNAIDETEIDGSAVPLHDFIGLLIFVAGSDALFASSVFNPPMYQDFKKFDRGTFYLAAGIPAFVLRAADSGRKALLKTLSSLKRDGDNNLPLIERRHVVFNKYNLSDKDFAAADLSLFWAGNTNTINIAFWVVYHAASDPQLLEKIHAEIEQATGDAERTKHDLPALTEPLLSDMPIMESTIYECLRMYAGSLMLREAMADFSFKLSNGDTLHAKKGERFSVFPRACHMDGEIFEQPDEFRYDRFIGKKALQSKLFPFGGGSNICPGRFFAISEFKLALTMLFSLFDMELVDPNKAPLPDKKRLMLGSASPLEDLDVRISWKDATSKQNAKVA